MAGHWETYLGQPRTGIGAFCEAYLPDRRLLGRTPDRGRCFQFSCCWNMTENAWEDANLHPSYVRPQGLSLFGHRGARRLPSSHLPHSLSFWDDREDT